MSLKEIHCIHCMCAQLFASLHLLKYEIASSFSVIMVFYIYSRYKNAMPDRYRDVASKCDRYLPPPHYLANGAPLVSTGGSMANNVVDSNSVNMYGNVMNRGLVSNNSIVQNSTDNYLSGYLSSTVHTPVKRYIPSTNTIATEIYSDSTVVLPHHQQVNSDKKSNLLFYTHFTFSSNL